mmetsp:Transcript_18973/g.37952  ORF Transcript_18973/g.37952 Transcript_18973/m.37952 type:complete len:597 (-) Transcript_18973:50-1840(-)
MARSPRSARSPRVASPSSRKSPTNLNRTRTSSSLNTVKTGYGQVYKAARPSTPEPQRGSAVDDLDVTISDVRPTKDSEIARKTNSYSNKARCERHLMKMKDEVESACDFIDRKFLGWRSGKEKDVHGEVLYRKVKGDQLAALARSLGEDGSGPRLIEDFEEVKNKCLDAYEDAMDFAEDTLVPTNALKVQVALRMSMALHDLCGWSLDALCVGKKALLRAEKFNAISARPMEEEEVEVLQVLREFVGTLETFLARRKMDKTESGRKFANLKELDEEANDDGNRNASQFEKFNTERRKSTLRGVDRLSLSLAHKVENLKRSFVISESAEPHFLLGDLSHAHQILSACRRIFNSYVRGNAVHAEAKTGTFVALDGQELDMDDFLLGGPYLSWEGFHFFCHDFNICARKDGKGNRKVNIRAGDSYLFSDVAEVQMVFTLTPLAPGPVLKVSASDPAKPWTAAAKNLWLDPTRVAEHSKHPTGGLNFAAFVDAVARLGLVGLSRGTWSEMFPTQQERVEAVFLTTMGVLDASVVEAHLHQHKKSQGLATSEYKGMTALTREHSLKSFEEAKLNRHRRRSSSAPVDFTKIGRAAMREDDDA